MTGGITQVDGPLLARSGRQWGYVFDHTGALGRGEFWVFILQIVAVWACALTVDMLAPYYMFPAIGILVRGLVMMLLIVVTGCALTNAVIRRLRDAGVSLLLPTTAFVLVCFAYVFDMLHVLSLRWYALDFWSGDGLSKFLEYMIQFGILTCVASTCGALVLSTRKRETD